MGIISGIQKCFVQKRYIDSRFNILKYLTSYSRLTYNLLLYKERDYFSINRCQIRHLFIEGFFALL